MLQVAYDNGFAVANSAGEIARGSTIQALHQVLDPGVNLSVWERRPDKALVGDINRLPNGWRDSVRFKAMASDFLPAMERAFDGTALESEALSSWLADMAMLAEAFAALTGRRSLEARLDTLTRAMCPRFHVDSNGLRLICTYRGIGTELLASHQVDRSALRRGESDEIMLQTTRPQRMPPYWVGIMKGSRFPGNGGSGLVHRSPPVEMPGDTRILFCLDAC